MPQSLVTWSLVFGVFFFSVDNDSAGSLLLQTLHTAPYCSQQTASYRQYESQFSNIPRLLLVFFPMPSHPLTELLSQHYHRQRHSEQLTTHSDRAEEERDLRPPAPKHQRETREFCPDHVIYNRDQLWMADTLW